MKLPIRAWSGMLAALGYSPKRQRATPHGKRPRRLRMESLESRQLLTATPLYWVGGASSNWNTTDANWSLTSGGSTKQAWTNGDQAVFDSNSPAGPVSVNSSLSADSIKFAKSYTVNGSSTLALNGANTIEVTPGLSAAISANVSMSGTTPSKIGSGTLTLSGSNSLSSFTVSTGKVVAGSTGAFSSSTAITVDATLDLNGNSLAVSSLSSTGSSGLVTNGATGTAVLTMGGANSTDYAGNIQDGNGGSGHVGLAVSQSFTTLTLSGNNTYTGSTTISGTLKAASTTAFSSGSAYSTGSSGGTLNLNGYNVNVGSLASLSGYGYGTVTNGYGAADGTLTVGSDGTSTTFSGVVENGNGTHHLFLTKTGGGTLTLSGANTYTGTTTLNGGAIKVSHSESVNSSGPLGKSAASNPGSIVFGGGTLQYSSSNTVDYSGRFSTAASQPISVDTNGQNVTFATALTSSSGSLTKLGTGTLTLSGSNTYTGTTTITQGTLAASSIVVSGSASNLGNATSAVVLGGSSTSGVLSYTGNSANFTRGFTVNAGGGEVDVTTSGQTLTISSGGISASGTLTLGGAGDSSISSVISGSGGLTKTGAGTATLSGSNTYTGTTTVSQGTVSAGSIVVSASASNLGNASSAVVLGASSTKGTLSYTGNSASYTRGFTVNAGGGEIDVTTSGQTLTIGTGGTSASGALTLGGSGNSTISSVISGSGSLTKTGSGALTLSGSNTYTGTTTISQGTVSAGSIVVSASASNLGNASSAVVLGAGGTKGTLSYTGNSATYTRGFTVSAGGGEIDVTTSAQTLTIGTGNISDSAGSLTVGGSGNTTISSVLSGAGTLTKTGAGTLTMSGANTYTGTTTLSGGTVNLGHSESAGSSGPLGNSAASNPGSIVFSGGTLQYSGSNQNDYSGRFSTAASQAISIDTNGQNVTLATALTSSGGTLTKTGTGTLRLTATNTYSGTTTISGGTLTLGDGSTYDGSVAGDIVDNAALAFANPDDQTYSGDISGIGTVTADGPGNLTLDGANSFSGGATVNVGILFIGSPASVGTGSISVTEETASLILVGTGITFSGPATFTTAVESVTIDTDSTPSTMNLIANGIWGAATEVDFYWDSNGNGVLDAGDDSLGSADSGDGWTLALTADGDDWDTPDEGTVVLTPNFIIFGVPVGGGGAGAAGVGGGFFESNPGALGNLVGLPEFVPVVNASGTAIVIGNPDFDFATQSSQVSAREYSDGVAANDGQFHYVGDYDNSLAAAADQVEGTVHDVDGTSHATSEISAIGTSTYFTQPGIGVSGILSATSTASCSYSGGSPPEAGADADSIATLAGGQTWTVIDSGTDGTPPVDSVEVQGFLQWGFVGSSEQDTQNGGYLASSFNMTVALNDGHTATVNVSGGDIGGVTVNTYSTDAVTVTGLPNLDGGTYSIGMAFHWVIPRTAVTPSLTATITYAASVEAYASSWEGYGGGSAIASCIGAYSFQMSVVGYS